MNRLKTSGFTIIEMLMSTVIIGMVILGVVKFSQSFFSGYEFSMEEGVVIDHAQTAIQTMERELREMKIAEDGSYPLVSALDQEVVFYSDVDNDNVVDRVRYYLVGTDLVKQVFPYERDQNYACVGGCVICHLGTNTLTIPEAAWPAHNAHQSDYLGACQPGGGTPPSVTAYEKVVASYIQQNGPIFGYYNGDWPGDSVNNPLASGQRLLNTRLIKVDITVDTNPAKSPLPFQLSTFIHLRNLKDNL